MELVIIIFSILIIFLVIKQLQPNMFSKSPAVKKSEIIDAYRKHIDTINTKEEKILYLKEINQELSRNIFFDQSEIKQTMQELTNYSFRDTSNN